MFCGPTGADQTIKEGCGGAANAAGVELMVRNRWVLASLIAFPALAVIAFAGAVFMPLLTDDSCQETVEDSVPVQGSPWVAKVIGQHCNALSSSMEIRLENANSGHSQDLIAFGNPEPVSIFSDHPGELTVAVPQSAKLTVSKTDAATVLVLVIGNDEIGFDAWKRHPNADQSRSWAREHGRAK